MTFTSSEPRIDRNRIAVAAAKALAVLVLAVVLASFALVTAVRMTQWVLGS